MSLSNKLTLDKVDVNGKRVVMRYASCFHLTQLIGCEIIWRLLPNCREGGDSSDICRTFPETFTLIMLTRRRRTYGQQCVTWFRAPVRLQEVICHVFIHVTYPRGDAAWMQRNDVVSINFNVRFPLCGTPSSSPKFRSFRYIIFSWFNGKMSN